MIIGAARFGYLVKQILDLHDNSISHLRPRFDPSQIKTMETFMPTNRVYRILIKSRTTSVCCHGRYLELNCTPIV